MEHIIMKHPQYDAISSSENKLGLYSRKKKMANLDVKDGNRHLYMFYCCCKKDDHPQCIDSWYSKVDKYSFVSCCLEEANINTSPLTETVSNNTVIKTSGVPIPINPWDSKEYKMFNGMTQNESGLDVTIHAMLDQLEQSISSNFVVLVDNYENEDDIQYMTVHAQNRIHLKRIYLSVAFERTLE
eukprot:13730864-Ditylum_brightwellii.AAC.1